MIRDLLSVLSVLLAAPDLRVRTTGLGTTVIERAYRHSGKVPSARPGDLFG